MKEIKYFAIKKDEGVEIIRVPGEDVTSINSYKKSDHVEITMPFCMDDPNHIVRETWVLNGDQIEVDIERAKEVYLTYLREVRLSKFEELDIEQLKALAKKDEDKIQEIEELKEALRDMPKSINWEMIETVYDLVHVMPPILM